MHLGGARECPLSLRFERPDGEDLGEHRISVQQLEAGELWRSFEDRTLTSSD